MTSAWGQSWGQSWGNSWGDVGAVVVTSPKRSGGPAYKKRQRFIPQLPPPPVIGVGNVNLPSVIAAGVGQVGQAARARAIFGSLSAKASGYGSVANLIPMLLLSGEAVVGVSGSVNVAKIAVIGKAKAHTGPVGKAHGTLSICSMQAKAEHDPDEAVVTALLMVA